MRATRVGRPDVSDSESGKGAKALDGTLATVRYPWDISIAWGVIGMQVATTVSVSITVNGVVRRIEVAPRTLLVHALREQVGLTGTNSGCDTSSCGACTVLVDGESVKSCTMLAVQADGTEVTTIEGLCDGDTLHPMQEAFRQHHGLQCGFCTPGMVMAAVSLLRENPDPSEHDVRMGL